MKPSVGSSHRLLQSYFSVTTISHLLISGKTESLGAKLTQDPDTTQDDTPLPAMCYYRRGDHRRTNDAHRDRTAIQSTQPNTRQCSTTWNPSASRTVEQTTKRRGQPTPHPAQSRSSASPTSTTTERTASTATSTISPARRSTGPTATSSTLQVSAR